jgi:hypothetical protein
MQHSITLLLVQITLTQPGGVLGHCPFENQMTVPLSAHQMFNVSLHNAVVAVLVKCALNSKQITDSVTSKAPPHITPPPPCFTVGTTHAEIIRSPTLRLTKTRQLEPKSSNLDSSVQRTDFHRSNVHCSCFFAQASLFFLLVL